DAEELIRYMKDGSKHVRTEAPTQESYVKFFASELEKAHHIIFIAFSSSVSEEYERALKASASFGNVTVINSECLSSACGMLALIAARLAGQNMPVDRIVAELEAAKHRLHCSFITKSTETITRQGKLSPVINATLTTLWLHPVLRLKDDKIGVGGLLFGNVRRCYEKYLDNAFKGKTIPDTSLLIVPYVGMEEEDLLWIEEKIRERVNFDHVIFQRTSAGVAANCGEGSFGLQYLTKGEKNYDLGKFFVEDIPSEPTSGDGAKAASKEETRDEKKSEVATAAPSKASGSSDMSGMSDKEGISLEDGLKYCGSKQALDKFLNAFRENIDTKSNEIEDAYNRGDISFYTIKVHALKTTSRMIGAKELSSLAESLEMAGKEGNQSYIDENTSKLLKLYRSYKEKLE
ncbi:MAG: DegV family EDD domain-containing protein, partial [Butyrivibrio sp.]|nr:DegV family EDD domain-containing protein [Butyrivibrio sp.]